MSRRMLLAALATVTVFLGSLVAQAEDIVFKDDVTRHVLTGDDDKDFDVTVTLTSDAVVIAPKKRGDATTIPYIAIGSITYDRRSKVRKMAYTMSPAKKHFITIQFKVGAVGDFAELEVSKGVAPKLVATLEARSGVKIERATSGD